MKQIFPKPKLLDIQHFEDERGMLSILEAGKTIPIDIMRVYFIHNVTDRNERGHHAHYVTDQYFVILNGSCKVGYTWGQEKFEVVLSDAKQCFYMPLMCWHWLSDFEPGTVVAVMASHYYDETDYIRDWSTYLEAVEA